MTSLPYDIFKKDAAALLWVEAAVDLDSARSRVQELARLRPAQYVIFDQRTQRIVATFTAENDPN